MPPVSLHAMLCTPSLLARACGVAGQQLCCHDGKLAASVYHSLLLQQGAMLQRMLSSDAANAAAPTAAAAQQPQQPNAADAPLAAPAAALNPLQPYIPPGLILPKVPGSSSTVRSAEFAAGAYSGAQLPPERWPEVAVVGRSNVGKSSLINCLLGSSSLAKVSKHPGKTQSINHYLVNRNWYLVDCPGYGYAKVSQAKRADWHSMTQQYFMRRGTLVDILLLVDASLPPKEADLAGAEWLLQRNLPLTLVFTKIDKAKQQQAGPAGNILAFRAGLQAAGLAVPAHFATSAAKKLGAQQLLQYLAQRRAHAAQQQQQLLQHSIS